MGLSTPEARVVYAPSKLGIFSELKVIAFCAFFLWANFIVAFLPLIVYGAYAGSYFCRAYFVVAAIDFAAPVRPRWASNRQLRPSWTLMRRRRPGPLPHTTADRELSHKNEKDSFVE